MDQKLGRAELPSVEIITFWKYSPFPLSHFLTGSSSFQPRQLQALAQVQKPLLASPSFSP